MAFRKWQVKKGDPRLTAVLAEECGIGHLAASVLVSRGHSRYEDAMAFLTPEETLSSPFELADMQKAVDRIHAAIDEFEKITVYGDYDCDGVTSTAMLYTYLTSIGADAEWYIPERNGEGYGLNRNAVGKIAAGGTRLLITVDNGISALDEAAYARELGLDLVITDHHQPGERLPDAVAVVNPHRADCPSSYKELAGVGVAFKLIAGLEDGDYQTALEYFSDIVAVGTVGDIVPLTGENRILVRNGLRALGMSDNAGLLALMEAASIDPQKITAQNIAFGLAPRINAAGRMGSAKLAVRLLLSEDEEEAAVLASELDAANRHRQEEEGAIVADVEEMLASDRSLLDGRLLILQKADWNHGIIGIVCSRLVERYGKPVLLMSGKEGELRGSARSIGEFHLFKALSANSEHLTRYGGHKLAAGFSLREEEFGAFRAGMEEYARAQFDFMPPACITVDKELSSADLTVEEIGSLAVLEPFGAQNDPPVFLLHNARIVRIVSLSGDKHQRLTLSLGGQELTALWFGMPSARLCCEAGQIVDLLVGASLNTYNGTTSVSLRIKDLRPAGFIQEKLFSARGYYEKLRRGEPVPKAIAGRGSPTREETASVYRFLRQNGGFAGGADELYLCLFSSGINYCKLRLLLDILEEADLIRFSPGGEGIMLCEKEGKADLNATPTMARLRTLLSAGA